MSQKNKSSPLVINTWQKLINLLDETKKWPIANITIQIENFSWCNSSIRKIRIDKEYGLAYLSLNQGYLEEFLILIKESFKSNHQPKNIIRKRRIKNARRPTRTQLKSPSR